jgi:hypothetical protein
MSFTNKFKAVIGGTAVAAGTGGFLFGRRVEQNIQLYKKKMGRNADKEFDPKNKKHVRALMDIVNRK